MAIITSLKLSAALIPFESVEGGIPGWIILRADTMTISPVKDGVSITVTAAGRAFNEIGFTSVRTSIPKGTYRITAVIAGDAGARLFIGPRLFVTAPAKDTFGPDIWETVGDGPKTVSGQYTVNEDGACRIIIGLGMKENVGKRISITEFRFEPLTAPKQEVKAGAGTEYDNIIITNIDVGSKPPMLPVTITIDEPRMLRTAGRRNLGFVLLALPHDDLFMNTERTGMSDEMKKTLAAIPASLCRIAHYAGSYHANSMGWKQAVGPLADRTPGKFDAWDKASVNHFGPAELISAMQSAHPDVRFIWTVNMRNDSADDAADLAEFLTSGGSRPRGIVNWAKYRIDAGASPANIVCYELGNEEEWKSSNRMSVSDYIDRSKKIIAAIRRVDPNAKFSPHAATAPWGYGRFKGEDWRDWHRTLLREMGNDISYLAFHPYYYGYPTSVIETYFDVIRDDIRAITGGDRIKLYISEHGLWPAQKDGQKWQTTWYTTHALMGCLATAQFINRLYARDDIGIATYHCLSGGPWGLVYRGKGNDALYTTGIADMLRVWDSAVGMKVLAADVRGEHADPKKDDISFTLTAMSTDTGMNMLIVNREETTARDAAFTFSGTYDIIRSVTLTAPSVHSCNDEREKRITVTESTAIRDARTYLVPAKSIVALFLKKKY
ncbi:MAG: hypothetical protein AABZ39_15030 [Spirochaetota bacterium]